MLKFVLGLERNKPTATLLLHAFQLRGNFKFEFVVKLTHLHYLFQSPLVDRLICLILFV